MELKPTLDRAFNSASIGIVSKDQFGNIAAVTQQASEIIEIARYLGISQPSVVRELKKHGISQSS
jgi:hypothetical protein